MQLCGCLCVLLWLCVCNCGLLCILMSIYYMHACAKLKVKQLMEMIMYCSQYKTWVMSNHVHYRWHNVEVYLTPAWHTKNKHACILLAAYYSALLGTLPTVPPCCCFLLGNLMMLYLQYHESYQLIQLYILD